MKTITVDSRRPCQPSITPSLSSSAEQHADSLVLDAVGRFVTAGEMSRADARRLYFNTRSQVD